MRSELYFVLGAITGFSLGVAVTMRRAREQYIKQLNEELNKVYGDKSELSPCTDIPAEESDESVLDMSQEEMNEMVETIKTNGYSSDLVSKLLIVYPEPAEFGMLADDGYEEETLYYYSDGVLANRLREVIDPATTVGSNFVDHFGEYEDDAVFARNISKKIDYEILLQLRTFADARRDDGKP